MKKSRLLPIHSNDLKKLPPDEVETILRQMKPDEWNELVHTWEFFARPNQLEPDGKWKIWVGLAGRGWGKTRTGVEWVRHRVKSGSMRIACVAPTKGDVRRVMVEGESGFLNVCWKGDKTYRGKEIGFPVWSPTNNTLTWANGAKAEFFSAEDPERLRGPQFEEAWCDEICLVAGSQVETISGPRGIETLTTNDLVLTRFGYKPVVDAWHTGKRDTWKITTKAGRSLQGTFDHPIMTTSGWKSLGQLKPGESILVWSGEENAGIGHNATTLTGPENYCTEKSTKKPTGLFQKVSTSITSMKTKATIALAILWHFLSQSTSSSTSQEVSTQTSTLGSVQGLSGITRHLKSSFALSVADSLNRLANEQSFALSHVVHDTITSVEKAERAEVYNITVKDCHEYFANGILNHNCAWTRMTETWDMLQFTLRLGKNPRIFISTTPKPVKLLRNIVSKENTESGKVIISSGSSYENSDNIDLDALRQYEGTRLGRQELYAEILDEAAGALWTRAILDKCDASHIADPLEFSKSLKRIVVSVDPAVTANEESDLTGIIVAGIDINGHAYVLEDATGMYLPEQWGSKAVELYHKYQADRIVAEKNQGGEMVRSTLKVADETVPVRLVSASRGKFARAEPVSALYERGFVFHCRDLHDLEQQMVTWEPLGSIGSPDRLDALVWAITDLLLKGRAQAPLELTYKSRNSLNLI